MGTPVAAATSLRRLVETGHRIVAVYTQPDRPSGRGNKIVFSPVKELALQFDLPILQPQKIKTPEAAETFRSHDADVAVVVAYGRILPADFLGAFPFGAVNVHFSLLPKYRGAAPVNWAIVNGESVTGVTTIKMDEGLDTGDVLLSRPTEIGIDETAPELMDRLSGIGADLLIETLDKLPTITSTAQDHDAATFAPIMTREDGHINWSRSAVDISNRIRGFQPFPGSYSFLNGKRTVFWSASACNCNNAEVGEPGQVIETESGVLIVAAGDGTFLCVNELQFEGKRRIPVLEALNSGQIAAGQRFS